MISHNYLEELLEGKSYEYKSQILDLVGKYNISADDPVFLVLIATGFLEVTLNEAPQGFERIFNNWTLEMQRTHQLAERELIERQKSAIAQAASELIRKTSSQKGSAIATPSSLISVGSFLLGVFLFGFLVGYFFHK